MLKSIRGSGNSNIVGYSGVQAIGIASLNATDAILLDTGFL
jgi:hypothetical protein